MKQRNMLKMTKAQLQQQLEEARDMQRRLKRTLNLALQDLKTISEKQREDIPDIKPASEAYEAIKRAQVEFDNNVTEPGGGGDSSRISFYIKSTSALGWTWEDDYTKNGSFSWCGAFAAYCYTNLNFNIRQKIFPSCYRLFNSWYNTSRRASEICIGDIVTVYTSEEQSPHYGNHIVLALSLIDENGDFETIEGNAKGYGPNGDWREGVSRRTRNIKNVACIYRPLDGDFDE